jgi:hypothetical protein
MTGSRHECLRYARVVPPGLRTLTLSRSDGRTVTLARSDRLEAGW